MASIMLNVNWTTVDSASNVDKCRENYSVWHKDLDILSPYMNLYVPVLFWLFSDYVCCSLCSLLKLFLAFSAANSKWVWQRWLDLNDSKKGLKFSASTSDFCVDFYWISHAENVCFFYYFSNSSFPSLYNYDVDLVHEVTWFCFMK